ncbi:L,D-transpeptidase [Chloroflexia bacterium SDU3-3]|nr:L,D-transpeptidase [Chloroflexia bacterium SDU3-3]
MSQQQAADAVTAAQQQDMARRANLGPTPLEGLPSFSTVYIPSSRHHLSDRAGFLSFWRENGGQLIFGDPVTDELVEDGKVVQYFSQAKFEYNPESGSIQLALLGSQLAAGRSFAPGSPDGGDMYFRETGHTLSGAFLIFWQKRGGLQIFGYPISEPLQETSSIDGQLRTVQYFERAKFEHFPDELYPLYRQQVAARGLKLAALHEVRLAALGQQAARLRGAPTAEVQPFSGAVAWSPKNYERRIEVNLTTQSLIAYEGSVPVYHALVASGQDGMNTPTGSFAIYDKLPIQDMVGSIGSESWYVPSVPWVQYVVGGVALHGTYWHDKWGTGTRMSHGCINLNIDDAQWLYEWADIGTSVNISY